jgi:hypothetical protein
VSELVFFAPLDTFVRLLCRGWRLAGDLGDHHGRYSVLLSKVEP